MVSHRVESTNWFNGCCHAQRMSEGDCILGMRKSWFAILGSGRFVQEGTQVNSGLIQGCCSRRNNGGRVEGKVDGRYFIGIQ